MAAPLLQITGLTADYDSPRRAGRAAPAVSEVDLAVEPGALFTLLGPSGCGKTTLLRSVAGLHRPRHGQITIRGRTVVDTADGTWVAPNRRRVGMVFQSHAVWPHLDVFDNAAFPLQSAPRRQRRSAIEIRRRVTEVLEQVELADVADRPASRLSGGQQQRLALARALVPEPDLLLLDEPLSNLDAPLRVSMRLELKRLQRELGVTMLFVTHDQDEALGLATTVGVMFDGRLAQVGPPETVYDAPVDRAVASFVGRANLLSGALRNGHFVSEDLGPVAVEPRSSWPAGSAATALIRPEQVVVAGPSESAGENRWPGTIRQVAFRGDVLDLVVQVGATTIDAQVAPNPERRLHPDTEVVVHLPRAALRLLPE